MAISKTMQAVRVYGVQDYRLEEVPVPQVGPGEVLVRVLATGICASDVKTHIGAARIWGGDGMSSYIQTPVIPGHEFVGRVVAASRSTPRMVGTSLATPCRNCCSIAS